MTASPNDLLKRAWHAREVLYKELFGPHKCSLPKKFEPPVDTRTVDITSPSELTNAFGKTLSEKEIPILVHEPNEIHPYWTYVTSGLTNPWFGQSEDVSGFGCELVLKTTKPGIWAFKLLRRLVYYIVSYSGTLSPGIMLQMDAQLFPQDKSDIKGIIVWYVDEAPDCIYQLPSGSFGIFSVVGITSDECEFIESIGDYGCWCIQQIMREEGHGQLTEPERKSVMTGQDIAAKVSSMRSYLENFGFSAGNL